MRGDDINGPWQYGEIVCPHCFIALAEHRFGRPLSWRLYAEGVNEHLTTVTPSGRTWNPETWLWDEQSDSSLSINEGG